MYITWSDCGLGYIKYYIKPLWQTEKVKKKLSFVTEHIMITTVSKTSAALNLDWFLIFKLYW